ncbi:hypothetical protein ACSSS7_003263 [Eimeria intestinalis]
MGHRHRSALKQQNKAFKGAYSKPKSPKEKRKRAAAAAAACSVNKTLAKPERLQQAKLRRLKLRREIQQIQGATASGPPPKVVVILPFSDAVSTEKVFAALRNELLQDSRRTDGHQHPKMEMEEDQAPLETQAFPTHSRYLFTLPDYARNPAIPKRRPQQVLLLPAPSMREAGDKLDDSMQQEGQHQPHQESELLRFMDLCSSCDVLLCIFGGNCTYDHSAFSARGYQVLHALKLQGLPPSVIGVGCTDSSVFTPGHSLQGKAAAADSLKYMHRYFDSELGADRKFFGVGGPAEWRAVVRALGAATPLSQVNLEVKSLLKGAEAAACRRRGHLLALSWRIACLSTSEDPQAPPEPCLEVVGLVRGAGVTCKLPVHVTGVGDFVASRIDALEPLRCPKRQEPPTVNSSAPPESETLGEDLAGVVEASQPLQQLDMAAVEQTWPTGDEIMGDDVNSSADCTRRVRVPKNVGDYERAWLESDTERSHSDNGDEDGMSCDADVPAEQDEYNAGGDTTCISVPDDTEDDWKPLNDSEEQQMQADKGPLGADAGVALQIDTPLDIPAKERFQKYRGLKSFRSSPWAKNEDLPLGYGRIIDVSSIKGLARYARRAHAELCNTTGGFSGRFCRMRLPLRHSHVLQQLIQQQPRLEGEALDEALAAAVARRLAGRFCASGAEAEKGASAPLSSADGDCMLPDFLVVSQLLQHESQVAVVHAQVTFCDQDPVKGKDPVLMMCGFRRFPAAPIYSEEPRQGVRSAAKWKFKRWAEPGATLTATVYAPLVLPPSPCILLRSDSAGFGSVGPKCCLRCSWFSPIELHTKRGLRGNIVEPLGTHGYMKCKFSDYLKQNDEV